MRSIDNASAMAAQARLQAPRAEVQDWHGLSVVTYDDGTSRAWHYHIDKGTRKLVWTRLSDPVDTCPDVPQWIVALQDAAAECEVAHRMQETLW